MSVTGGVLTAAAAKKKLSILKERVTLGRKLLFPVENGGFARVLRSFWYHLDWSTFQVTTNNKNVVDDNTSNDDDNNNNNNNNKAAGRRTTTTGTTTTTFNLSCQYKVDKSVCIARQQPPKSVSEKQQQHSSSASSSSSSSSSSSLVFPLSGLMALMDDVTTGTIMINDGKHYCYRPGVSVVLRAVRVGSSVSGKDASSSSSSFSETIIKPGDLLTIETYITKMGNIMGTCGASIYKNTNTNNNNPQPTTTTTTTNTTTTQTTTNNNNSLLLVCQGSHTKYLPMGSFLMEFMMGKWGFPFLKFFYGNRSSSDNEDNDSMLQQQQSSKQMQEGAGEECNSSSSTTTTLLLEEEAHYNFVENGKSGSSSGASSGSKTSMEEALSSLQMVENGVFHFTGDERHTNPMGALHGGCQAMLMEQAGLETIMAQQQQQQYPDTMMIEIVAPVLESMHVVYISPGSVNHELKVTCNIIHATDSMKSLLVTIKQQQQGKEEYKTISEAHQIWMTTTTTTTNVTTRTTRNNSDKEGKDEEEHHYSATSWSRL